MLARQLMCSLLLCSAAVALLAHSPAARAEDAPASPTESAEPPPKRSYIFLPKSSKAEDLPPTPRKAAAESYWYGVPLLALDAIALGVAAVGSASNDTEVVTIGIVAATTNGLFPPSAASTGGLDLARVCSALGCAVGSPASAAQLEPVAPK